MSETWLEQLCSLPPDVALAMMTRVRDWIDEKSLSLHGQSAVNTDLEAPYRLAEALQGFFYVRAHKANPAEYPLVAGDGRCVQ